MTFSVGQRVRLMRFTAPVAATADVRRHMGAEGNVHGIDSEGYNVIFDGDRQAYFIHANELERVQDGLAKAVLAYQEAVE